MKFFKVSYILIFFLVYFKAHSEINTKKDIDFIKSIDEKIYSFAILGHAYGAPSASVFPSASLLSGRHNDLVVH